MVALSKDGKGSEMPIGPQTIQEFASTVLKESQTLSKGWLRRHWFDIALLLILPAGWLLFRYVSRQNFPHGQSQQVVVSSRSELEAFRVIGPGDVSLEKVKTVAGSLSKLDDVVGHYPVEILSPKAVIKKDQISARNIDSRELAGRHAVVVPIKLGPLAGSTKFPLRVLLLVSSRIAGSKPLLIPDAYVLAAKDVNGTTYAMAAVTGEQAASLAAVLGNADITISIPIRP